jgi:hypothetical protein
MNERIKELAVQAMVEHCVSHVRLQEFAELIVRECVGKCEFVANMATVTNDGEMARKTKATAESCATMIKEHFGVEE